MPTTQPNPNSIRYDLPFTSYDLIHALANVPLDARGYAVRNGRSKYIPDDLDDEVATISMTHQVQLGEALHRCQGSGAGRGYRRASEQMHMLWPGESPATTSIAGARRYSTSTSSQPTASAAVDPSSSITFSGGSGARRRSFTSNMRRFSFKSILTVPRPSLVPLPLAGEGISENAISTTSSGTSSPSRSSSLDPVRSEQSLRLRAANVAGADAGLIGGDGEDEREAARQAGDRVLFAPRPGKRRSKSEKTHRWMSAQRDGVGGGTVVISGSRWRQAWKNFRRLSIGSS